MSRTFLTQDTQIRNSDAYDDNLPITEAGFETNPANIQEDLNNIRSRLSELMDIQATDWWTALTAPTALETGTARGVQDLNASLHAVEKKRILRCVFSLVDITVPASVAATATLTNATNFLDTETVTIDGKVYTFQTSLTNVDGNVQIGASVALSHENLRRAINLDGVAGTNYAAATTLHPTVSATDTATTTIVTAKVSGSAANAIAVSETASTGSWSGATLAGGAGDAVILAAGELPGNTTAAVGVVTTLGTVVAFHSGTFGNHILDTVTGPTAISPKNLLTVVEGSTRDPILSSGRQIYGLLQTETATNPHTITDTTTTRAQISFVRLSATGSTLEAVPATDIGSQVINYCYVERVRLEDLSEADFLGGANIDVPSGSTVTRQVAYDNQGVTPVELLNNADLDLAAGIEWAIRDLANADLLRLVEGSGGGTSTVEIAAATDIFDVNAVVNDFNAGATIRSGGTRPIAVGVTDGIIASTAGDLGITAAAELLFDDVNQNGSTWAQTTGIKLSETTAEWDAFEAEFGEVSLLAAITAASNSAGADKIYAIVQSTVTADTDISLGDGNLDVSLGDLSAGSFLTDYDVYLNGQLLRPGANAAANNDYYPGTSLAAGQLKFEFSVRVDSVICIQRRV